MTRMIRNKNDSINSILQHSCVVDYSFCVVFPTSRFPYFIRCPMQCKLKVATTHLAIRTKNNQNVFDYENLLLLKPPLNYKKQHGTLQSLREKKEQ